MFLKKFIRELKRRHVIKSALAYLAVAWILLQVFSILLPLIDTPKWVLKTLTLIMLIGFPCWTIFSWNYQISPNGLKKNEISDFNFSRNLKLLSAFIIIGILTLIGFNISHQNKKKQNIEKSSSGDNINISVVENSNLTASLVALELYHKGEFHHQKQSLHDINLAIEYYQKAIQIDSLFAMAYSNLGSAYMRKNLSFDPNVKWEEEAYAASSIALKLDPNLTDPHIIQGQFYWSPSHNFAHEEAINAFEKAVFKDPSNSESYEQLSLVQLHIGLFDKALQNAKNSISLDPVNYRARRFIGEIYLFQGDYAGAIKEFNKIPNSFAPQPTQAFKALTYFYLEQPEKAIEILDENLINFPNSPHINGVYAIILSSIGREKEAYEKMELAIQNTVDYIHAHHIYYYLGTASALMDEKEEAIDWLEKAAISGFPNYPLYKSDPNLKSLEKEKAYLELLSKLKEDWEHYKTI